MDHNPRPEDFLPYYLPINHTCNQRCVFCASYSGGAQQASDPDDIVSRLSVLRNKKLITAVAFTGGEPTINPHLAGYIRAAADLGFVVIGIETNGMMLSYPKYAEALAVSGLTRVCVTMASHKPSVSDELTQVRGGWALTNKGIEWAIGRGLNVVLQIPLLAAAIGELDEHVKFIIGTYPGVHRIELRIMDAETRGHGDIPIGILEAALGRALGVARPRGVKVSFQACFGPAPCLFEKPRELVSIFNYPAAEDTEKPDYPLVDACRECLIGCVCPGVHPRYAENAPAGDSKKITPEFARRVLRPGPGRGRRPIEDQRRQGEANFCTFSYTADSEGNKLIREAMLRINYNCNQRCLFCWIEPGYDDHPHDEVVKKIDEFTALKLKTVSITGGEPTLNPHLVEYLNLIREAGAKEICLQTNAMLLNEPERARALIDAGLNSAFISLHSHMPEISDMVTGIEGGFEKTVGGIRNLSRCGAIVFISHVINSFNYRALPEFVEYIAENFKKVPIIFSYAAPIFGAMMHRGLIPLLTEIKVPLIAALEKCYELKVPFAGLSGKCGIPPCILDGNLRYYLDINLVSAPDGDGDMLKIACCKQCSLNQYCYGLRRNYAEIYGTDEIHAVQVDDVKPVVLEYVKPEDFFNQQIS